MKKTNLLFKTVLLLFVVLIEWKCTNPHGNDDPFFDTLIASLYSGYKLTYVIDGMIDSSNATLQQARIIFEDFLFFAETAVVCFDTIKLGGYESDSGYVNIYYRFQDTGDDSLNLFETIHCLNDSCYIFPFNRKIFGNSESFKIPFYYYIHIEGGSIFTCQTFVKLNCDSLTSNFISSADINDTLELYTWMLLFQ